MPKVEFEPIGKVESKYLRPKELIFACEQGLKTKAESTINIYKKFQAGLSGLEEFSHLWVIYHLHLADKLELVTYPGTPEMTDLPKVGVFASRSQYRPNKIALRLAKIVKVEKDKITVSGLDAVDGSQVLDLKPYVPGFDRPDNYKRAEWYSWLDK